MVHRIVKGALWNLTVLIFILGIPGDFSANAQGVYVEYLHLNGTLSAGAVSDISTAVLVKQFYREYNTRPTAESLRKAIQHVKQRYPHPGYWGAFVLAGDYL
jgi:hypothetical protein